MVSALHIVHQEGITMHCIHYLRYLCIKQQSNSPGMKKSQLDLLTPAQIAGKHVNVTKNTKKTETSCFHDYNITKTSYIIMQTLKVAFIIHHKDYIINSGTAVDY